MISQRCLLVVLVVAGFLSPALRAADPTANPAELQQLFDQGQYPQLLAKLNTALAANQSDSDKPARYALLMLKGESLLRTKAKDSAVDAFKAASLVGGDDKEIAIARADAALIKRSSNNKYQPKTKTDAKLPAPLAIDIVASASRKEAFAALFSDLLETAKPLVDAAEKQDTLPSIENAAVQMADLRPVELAATDSDSQSKELVKALSDHAAKLMLAAIAKLEKQIDPVSKDASKRMKQMRISPKTKNPSSLEAALSPEDVTRLENIVTQTKEIGSTAVTMQASLGEGGDLKNVETAAQQTIDKVNKLLKQFDHGPAT